MDTTTLLLIVLIWLWLRSARKGGPPMNFRGPRVWTVLKPPQRMSSGWRRGR